VPAVAHTTVQENPHARAFPLTPVKLAELAMIRGSCCIRTLVVRESASHAWYLDASCEAGFSALNSAI
jgi:hypothetical protein